VIHPVTSSIEDIAREAAKSNAVEEELEQCCAKEIQEKPQPRRTARISSESDMLLDAQKWLMGLVNVGTH
jgi:hypothetical protein